MKKQHGILLLTIAVILFSLFGCTKAVNQPDHPGFPEMETSETQNETSLSTTPLSPTSSPTSQSTDFSIIKIGYQDEDVLIITIQLPENISDVPDFYLEDALMDCISQENKPDMVYCVTEFQNPEIQYSIYYQTSLDATLHLLDRFKISDYLEEQ